MFDGHETGLWLLRARVEGRGDVLTFFHFHRTSCGGEAEI